MKKQKLFSMDERKKAIQQILKIQQMANQEFDDAKRGKDYLPALNRVNEKAYIFPVSELPIVWAHNKDVFVKPNPLTKAVPILGDYGWK